MAEVAAKARAKQMKTYGQCLKALDRKKHFTVLLQSRPLVDEESNASDDSNDECPLKQMRTAASVEEPSQSSAIFCVGPSGH